MERTAFSRARDYLNSSPRAKWLAIVAGTGAGIFYVFLVLLFALLVDLLDSRGRTPNFAQLSVPEQEQFLEIWKGLQATERAQAVQQIGCGDFDAASKAPASAKPEDKRRYQSWLALTGTEELPPLPGKMNADNLKTWSRGRADETPYVLAMKEHELRWRAYVWWYLKEHVGPDAANAYQPKVPAGERPPVPGLGEEDRTPHGVLSLLVRLRGTFFGRLLNGLASMNHWMWEPGAAGDANRSYLNGLTLLAIIGAALAALCLIVMDLQAARATVEAVVRLRRAVYHHASRLSEIALRSNGTPDAHALFTRNIEAMHDALYLWLTTISRYPAQVILLLGLALIVQPWLALAMVFSALLVWLVGGRVAVALRRRGRESTRLASSRLALMLESIKLMRLVKSYLMELFNQTRVERQLSEYSRAHLTRYRGDAFAKPVLQLLVASAVIGVLYVSGRVVLGDGLSLAGLTILVVAVSGLYPPVKGWFNLNRHLRRGRDASAAFFEFLDRQADQTQIADAEFLQPLTRSLEFKEVSFRRPGEGEPILSDINLVVRAGEKISIMGADEETKRALLYLIPRFFDPTEGEMRIDGRNLRWVTHESLRAQIGLVMQGNLIFNDTVANNIGCGDPSITLPRIIEAAKLAHAHQFVQKLPYGYETAIGDIGHSLRIGEQFRIALARAIVRDPAIFIIEEPPVVLDDDTKSLLDDTFERVLPGKTVLFLPHRISTLRHCERIVLLHDGGIEAIGSHHDLVRGSALYKHLYYLEFNAFAEQA